MFNFTAPIVVLGDNTLRDKIMTVGISPDKKIGMISVHKRLPNQKDIPLYAEIPADEVTGKRLLTLGFASREAVKKVAENLMRLYDMMED